jgi:hypothetical protein
MSVSSEVAPIIDARPRPSTTSRGIARARVAALGAGAALLLTSCFSGAYGSGPSSDTSANGSASTTTAAGGTAEAPSTATKTTDDSPAFSGEHFTADEAAQLQTEVDNGQHTWRLDEMTVAQSFVRSRFGWTRVYAALAFPETIQVTNRAGGDVVTLQLRQPVRTGPGGIWVVDNGVRAN